MLFLLLAQNYIFAQEDAAPSGTKSPFELFWPLTAGKTIDDPLYFLKSIKENLRGILIFGVAQKADYAVLIGTKRVLEAEKLLNQGKRDMADKTLGLALEQFNIAEKNTDNLKEKGEKLGQAASTMQPRLDNLINFLPTLRLDKSDEVLQKIKLLRNKL